MISPRGPIYEFREMFCGYADNGSRTEYRCCSPVDRLRDWELPTHFKKKLLAT